MNILNLEFRDNVSVEGPRETILLADPSSPRSTTSDVQSASNTPKLPNHPFVFSIESGTGNFSPTQTTTDAAGKSSSTLTAGSVTDIAVVKAGPPESTAAADARVYMYRDVYQNAVFDFNQIITDTQFTTSSSNLDSQPEIQTWLNGKTGKLKNMYKRVEQLAKDKKIYVETAQGAPSSGTLMIDAEQMTYSSVRCYPVNICSSYGAVYMIFARAVNSTVLAQHPVGSVVRIGTVSTAAIPPNAQVINVTTTTGALDSGTLKIWTSTSTVLVTYTGKTAQSFTGCERQGGSAITFPAGTAVFYPSTIVGVSPARLIIDNSAIVENGTTVSTNLILANMQREARLVTDANASDTAFDTAMGYSGGDDFVSQLYLGTENFREKFNQNVQLPFVFDGRPSTWPLRTHWDFSTTLVDVKLKANNKASVALWKHNQFTRSKPEGGGNYLFFTVWKDFNF